LHHQLEKGREAGFHRKEAGIQREWNGGILMEKREKLVKKGEREEKGLGGGPSPSY